MSIVHRTSRKRLPLHIPPTLSFYRASRIDTQPRSSSSIRESHSMARGFSYAPFLEPLQVHAPQPSAASSRSNIGVSPCPIFIGRVSPPAPQRLSAQERALSTPAPTIPSAVGIESSPSASPAHHPHCGHSCRSWLGRD